MVERFVRDDAGYLAWLAAHPVGYVLNTFVHAKAGYLVLHRASCRTINRVLAEGSAWTVPYAKVCGDTAGAITVWSVDATGSPPRACGHCTPDGGLDAAAIPPVGRRPRTDVVVSYEGTPVRLTIPRLDGGPELVIEGAQWLAELFFRMDASATGGDSYDAWALLTDPDRFTIEDVIAINRTMAARSPHAVWTDVISPDPAGSLMDLDPRWDLVSSDGGEPVAAAARAIAGMEKSGRRMAVVTKMLHLKRPALVPVLDSLVVEQLGAEGESLPDLLGHVRTVGRRNLGALDAIAAHLATIPGWDERPIVRTHVRILDALLWTSHPRSVLNPKLEGWRMRLEAPTTGQGE